MKAARGSMAAAVVGLLTVMIVLGPGYHSLAYGSEEEFGAGLTDIGPDATDALRVAFRDDAEAWLDATLFVLTPEGTAQSDPTDWLNLCTQFSNAFEANVTNAKNAAETYLGDKWSGDLPKDWIQKIRDGRKFILYMAESGHKAYSDWAEFADWAKGYRTDKASMTGRIKEMKPDFVKLDALISKASTTVVEGKKDAAKTLKTILRDVERFEENTIPNDLDILEKYRKLAESTTETERRPDAVKKKLEDTAKAVEDTVKLCAGTFPATAAFAQSWASNGKQLAEDYKKAYDEFVEATKPILGDTPPLWSSLTHFEDWKLSEFATNLTAMRKRIQSEITRIEGVPLVD
ncbi:MAG: hypothetical protein JW889_16220 [Verrucomicrobia bacterium]|nr:hypothetical protein [Verrucomicrobiota bacterium]